MSFSSERWVHPHESWRTCSLNRAAWHEGWKSSQSCKCVTQISCLEEAHWLRAPAAAWYFHANITFPMGCFLWNNGQNRYTNASPFLWGSRLLWGHLWLESSSAWPSTFLELCCSLRLLLLNPPSFPLPLRGIRHARKTLPPLTSFLF